MEDSKFVALMFFEINFRDQTVFFHLWTFRSPKCLIERWKLWFCSWCVLYWFKYFKWSCLNEVIPVVAGSMSSVNEINKNIFSVFGFSCFMHRFKRNASCRGISKVVNFSFDMFMDWRKTWCIRNFRRTIVLNYNFFNFWFLGDPAVWPDIHSEWFCKWFLLHLCRFLINLSWTESYL